MGINGYVDFENEKSAFDLENFKIKIFNDKGFYIFSEKTDVPDYLYGVTDTNYNILLITTGEARNVARYTQLFIPAYFIAKANCIHYDIAKIDRIDFVGGTINSIYEQNILFDVNDWKDCTTNKGFGLNFRPLKEVSKEYQIKINNLDVTLKLTFAYNVRHTDSKNNKLGEVNTNLSFIFSDTQSPDILVECYRIVHKILSILTLQSNIKIDKIITYQKDNRLRLMEVADVFVYERPLENYVEKSSARVIPFRVFDSCFDKFINVIMNEEFSTNFLPSNNKDVDMVDYDLVKNICTALEFEFQTNKEHLNINKNNSIVELTNIVKEQVKTFKTSHTELSERYYNYINSNIATWSLPATEQFMCLYEYNKNILDKLLSNKNLENMNIVINEENINKFVKLRNGIVHGNRPPITQENANFSYAMKLLIYASMLKRMGLQEDKIYNILMEVL